MKARQPDLLDHTPAKLAQAWRTAAAKSREQFPLDESRARWYEREAERYAAIATAQNVAHSHIAATARRHEGEQNETV